MAKFWAKFPELRGTVFIVTYGRSGSTLLQSVVQSIRGAHFTGENYLALLPLMNTVRRVQGARNDWGKTKLEPNRPWFGASQMKPNLYRDACIAAFVNHVLQPPQEARWIGFKEIRYSEVGNQFNDLMEFMRAGFPNARFIFNSRDAKSVSESRWWRQHSFEKVCEMIADMDQRFSAYQRAHPDIAVHLKYETYADDPMGFKPIFDLLSEPFDQEAVERILKVKLSH